MATALDMRPGEDAEGPSELRRPDLNVIPPLHQQLGWLDNLTSRPSDYSIVWLAQLTSVGSMAYRLNDPAGEPRIFVSYPNDDHWDERRNRIESLCRHMIACGMRDAVLAVLP